MCYVLYGIHIVSWHELRGTYNSTTMWLSRRVWASAAGLVLGAAACHASDVVGGGGGGGDIGSGLMGLALFLNAFAPSDTTHSTKEQDRQFWIALLVIVVVCVLFCVCAHPRNWRRLTCRPPTGLPWGSYQDTPLVGVFKEEGAMKYHDIKRKYGWFGWRCDACSKFTPSEDARGKDQPVRYMFFGDRRDMCEECFGKWAQHPQTGEIGNYRIATIPPEDIREEKATTYIYRPKERFTMQRRGEAISAV